VERPTEKILRLVLGDQLNSQHSWFKEVDHRFTYVMMEIRTETDYATHHIQKIVAFFAAMRQFSKELIEKKHQVIYMALNDENNCQSFAKNLELLLIKEKFIHFEYQLPDEYRVDALLKLFCETLNIKHAVVDSEHFLGTRQELGDFFKGKKTYLMEGFYRFMRKKHKVLMNGGEPLSGQWNYDKENRKKLPLKHKCTSPLVFDNDVSEITHMISETNIKTIGTIDAKRLVWPISRN